MLTEWRQIFYITLILYTLATTVYLVWGSGEVQPWNEVPNKPEDMATDLKTSQTVENAVKLFTFLFISAIVLLLITYI